MSWFWVPALLLFSFCAGFLCILAITLHHSPAYEVEGKVGIPRRSYQRCQLVGEERNTIHSSMFKCFKWKENIVFWFYGDGFRTVNSVSTTEPYLLLSGDLFYDNILSRASGDEVLTFTVFSNRSEKYLWVEEVPNKIKLYLNVLCYSRYRVEGIKKQERFPSHSGHHRALSRVPCAIE